MNKYIKFVDYFSAVLDDKPTEQNKDFLNLLLPGKTKRKHLSKEVQDDTSIIIPKVLGVKIAATHAAKVTDNNGFYLPDKMKAGVKSWIEPFEKPILLHHDKEEDAIGRVRSAQYIDMSDGFRRETELIKRADKIVGDYPGDRLIDAFIAGELSPVEAVDVVRNLFVVKDFNYTKDSTYHGLGYIELTASLSDPDAIRKTLDKRYLTGSMSARSDAAVCSICKKDWLKDGMCDHRPGKKYKDILCVIITGNFIYDEYSYVNRPADGLSRNLEIFTDGQVTDSINLDAVDNIGEVWFNIDDQLTEIPGVVDNQEVLDDNKSKELDMDPLQILKDELADEFDSIVGTEPTEDDIHYAQMIADVKAGRLDLTEDEVKEVLDAKLTAEARKKLSGSTFCKPGEKKYPVPDCSHAKSAMAYAKKYNEASSVVACIKRKASRLGCPFKDEVQEDTINEGIFVLDYFDEFSDLELQQMSIGLDKALGERGLQSSLKDIENTINTLKTENDSLKTQVTELDTLKEELQDTYNNLEVSKLAVIDANEKLKKNTVSNLVFMKLLVGDKVEDTETEIIDMMNFEDDKLVELETELKDKIDVNKLNELLTQGVARKVDDNVVVNDPSLRYTEDNSNDIDDKTKDVGLTQEMLDKVKEEYLLIRFNSGQDAANAYLNNLKNKGIIPKENPFK